MKLVNHFSVLTDYYFDKNVKIFALKSYKCILPTIELILSQTNVNVGPSYEETSVMILLFYY